MLTDAEIKSLIKCPKKITGSVPAKGLTSDPKSSFLLSENSGDTEFRGHDT